MSDEPCANYTHAEMVETIGLRDQAWPCRRCGHRQDRHASWPQFTVIERACRAIAPPWRAFGPVYWLASIGSGILIAILIMLAIGWLP